MPSHKLPLLKVSIEALAKHDGHDGASSGLSFLHDLVSLLLVESLYVSDYCVHITLDCGLDYCKLVDFSGLAEGLEALSHGEQTVGLAKLNRRHVGVHEVPVVVHVVSPGLHEGVEGPDSVHLLDLDLHPEVVEDLRESQLLRCGDLKDPGSASVLHEVGVALPNSQSLSHISLSLLLEESFEGLDLFNIELLALGPDLEGSLLLLECALKEHVPHLV